METLYYVILVFISISDERKLGEDVGQLLANDWRIRQALDFSWYIALPSLGELECTRLGAVQ